MLDITRPGTTGLELNRAARAPGDARRPWLDHFYLIHGIGTDSAEMPLIGTDLGEEFDECIVLAPGMVMVLEPVIWDDGDGGYRSRGDGGGHRDRVPLPQPLPLHALRRGDGDVVRLGTMALYDGARVDFARLRRERRERVLDAMRERDLDVLIFGREPNARTSRACAVSTWPAPARGVPAVSSCASATRCT